MFLNGYNVIIYSSIFISLFLIDYLLGNGFVDMFQRMFCKVVCFIKKTVREEAQLAAMATGKDSTPISITMLIIEIMLLTLTVGILNRYKTYNRGKDRIDELLQESKDALQTTNEFLEKWRLRRINWQVPTQYSYLDEEPQEIKPLKLEVPLLHMAIVDTLGTTRSQLERGDAADTINFTDSTLLSVSSLFDDDESISEPVLEDAQSDQDIELGQTKSIEFRNRYLWDVMEEDANNLDD